MTRKIAIFGTTPSRMEGPWQDDSGWERWTIGPGGKDAHGWERLYEIHGSHAMHTWPEDFKGYLNDLSLVKSPREVWMMQPIEKAMAWWAHKHAKTPEQVKADITGGWSAVKVIDRDGLTDRYGRMWFSSSISWCIAQALEEPDVTDIGCWGIDLESGEEYISQFVGAKFFITLAQLKGINVHIPKGCGLLRDPTPYPDRYETEFSNAIYARLNRANGMMAQLRAEHEAVVAEQYRIEGQIIVTRSIDSDPARETVKALEQKYREQLAKVGELAAKINVLTGEAGSMEFMRHRYVMNLHDPV